ncbi:tol-pal system YbgF family protein [Geothrix sp. 21YS21S-2]|uniref:tetratricopeptide repeat protein n=1 Tax=Geothrix sp. 21YS21S-2 TaxID=3068893 RepID=UPI0027BB1BFA|nr:tetratricopeptide repeat protein [Geothrix sp. 21YS21S-2]
MTNRAMLSTLTLTGLLLCVGCSSEDRLKKVEDQVTDLKVEIFKLRSQMEDANKKAADDRQASEVSRTQDRRFQADLQETMRQLQDSTRVLNNRLGDAAAAPRRPASRPQPADEPPAAASDDEKAFNSAVLDYNRGNYALAADGLALFIKAHPQSPRTPDALFYLGLSSYNQKAYDKAQPSFERILKEFPSSNQFLPAKLKRAQCLLKQGLKPAAIKAFKEITDSFRGTPEARTAKQELDDLGF